MASYQRSDCVKKITWHMASYQYSDCVKGLHGTWLITSIVIVLKDHSMLLF